MGHRPDAAAGPAGGAATRRDRDGWARAGVHLRSVARHRPALRAGAGPRVLTNQAAPRVESRSQDLGERGRIEPSPVAGGWRTGAGAGLADWRRPDAEELLADERAACGVPAGEHSADESHAFRPELSRDAAATGLYRAGVTTSRSRSGCAVSRHRYVTFPGRRSGGRRAPYPPGQGPRTTYHTRRRDTSVRWECPC